MTDDISVMALRFRVGIPIGHPNGTCMHQSCKDHGASKEFCGKALDEYGDHAVTCGMGGHLFTRHGDLNSILCQAGRDVGYLALMEQVVPDFARWEMDKML